MAASKRAQRGKPVPTAKSGLVRHNIYADLQRADLEALAMWFVAQNEALEKALKAPVTLESRCPCCDADIMLYGPRRRSL